MSNIFGRPLRWSVTSCLVVLLPSTVFAGEDGSVTLKLSAKDYQQFVSAYQSCSHKDLATIELCKKLQHILKTASPHVPKETVPKILTRASQGKPSSNPPSETPFLPIASDDNQWIFVRADAIDNFWYDVPATAPKGASVSYTNNGENHTRTATITGMASAVLLQGERQPISDNSFEIVNALAVFAYGNGTWNNPLKTIPADQTTRYGVNAQWDLITPWRDGLRDIYLSVAPYDQTDFYSREKAEGIDLALQPVFAPLALGYSQFWDDYLGFYWIFRPEFDDRKVSNPGVTHQIAGSYEWTGAILRGYLSLFPFNTDHYWGPYLENRFSLVGTYEYFSDIHYGQTVRYYSVALQYNLGNATCKSEKDPGVLPNCAIAGNSTLSFEYDKGINKDSLTPVNQYLLKLTFAY